MHKRKNWNDINKTKMKNFLDYSNGFYKNIVGIPTGDPNFMKNRNFMKRMFICLKLNKENWFITDYK